MQFSDYLLVLIEVLTSVVCLVIAYCLLLLIFIGVLTQLVMCRREYSGV